MIGELTREMTIRIYTVQNMATIPKNLISPLFQLRLCYSSYAFFVLFCLLNLIMIIMVMVLLVSIQIIRFIITCHRNQSNLDIIILVVFKREVRGRRSNVLYSV